MADASILLKGANGTTTKTIAMGEAGTTDGNFVRTWETVDFGDPKPTPYGHPMPFSHGWVETAPPSFSEIRTLTTTMRVHYVGSNPERFLRQDWEDWSELYSPRWSSPTEFRVDTLDSAGVAVSRIIDVRLLSHKGDWTSQAKWFGSSSGFYVLPMTWEAKFPLFRDRLDTTITDSSALSNAANTDTLSLTPKGVAEPGLRLVVSGTGGAGAMTSLIVLNTTSGASFTWSDAGFTNADYVDFQVTSPNEPVGWTAGGTLDREAAMYLDFGVANSISLTAAGSGTWNLTLTATTRQYWEQP